MSVVDRLTLGYDNFRPQNKVGTIVVEDFVFFNETVEEEKFEEVEGDDEYDCLPTWEPSVPRCLDLGELYEREGKDADFRIDHQSSRNGRKGPRPTQKPRYKNVRRGFAREK